MPDQQTLPEPWGSLAREWVPRLLAAFSAEGWEHPTGGVRLLGLPPAPDVIDGVAYIHVGCITYSCHHPVVTAYLTGQRTTIGGHDVSWQEPWPEIMGIPGGLRIAWKTPGRVHGLLARIAGVTIIEVRLYPTSAMIIMSGIEDKVLRW